VSTHPPEPLAKFEEGLRGVIGLLSDPKVEVATLEQSVERLSRLFGELRSTASASPGALLARTAGLNAVAHQLAGEQLEVVAEHIVIARRLQLALDRSCEADGTGEYCDVER